MPKRILTECPYCHRRVSVFGANILKTKGEHCCRGCKCISNVVIHNALYAIGSIAVVSSLLTLVLYSAYGDHGDIRGVIYVLIPFIIFYLLVPFFIKLEPCLDRSAVQKLKRKISPVPVPEPKSIPRQRINKKTEERTELPVITESEDTSEPIELDVGDDFRESFARAKSMAKASPAEEGEAVMSDISSGSEAGDEEDVKVYSRAGVSEKKPEHENINGSGPEEVSLFGMKTVKVQQDEPEEDEADGSEVSFIFGRR